ncbi:hypothetical protein [Pseudomonas reactans]|uniref:hypothetical protein n=1 Tax=Pseudomonas reactans TaxID=117680 RepID=UPI0015A1F22D|nr:hypothetical protein [Pseudomonas reactans]NWA69882.1 hypothetical protein [Pseudomonas reactans]
MSESGQKAEGFAIAQAGEGGVANVTLNFNFGPSLDKASGWSGDKLEEACRSLKVTEATINMIIDVMEKHGVSSAEYPSEMRRLSKKFNEIASSVGTLKVDGSAVDNLYQKANNLILSARTDSDLDEPQDLLYQALQLSAQMVSEKAVQINNLVADRDKALSDLSKVSVRVAELAELRFQYGDAARSYLQIAESYRDIGDVSEWERFLLKSADVLKTGAERNSDRGMLEKSILQYRDLYSQAHSAQSGRLGDILLEYGSALALMGERSSDTVHLIKALDIYKEAEVFFSDDSEVCSMVLQNIAVVGFHLADRSSVDEANKIVLDSFASALRAIESCDQTRHPFKWALAVYSYATNRLARIRPDEPDALSTYTELFNSLVEVADIFEQYDSFHWAAAKNSISNACVSLAKALVVRQIFVGFVDYLKLALKCLEEAQTVWTLEKAPSDWVIAEMNKGLVCSLSMLAEGNESAADEGVVFFKSAIAQAEKINSPIQAAESYHNLGILLYQQGFMKRSVVHLSSAIEAFSKSTGVRTADNYPVQNEVSKRLIKQCTLKLAELYRSED